MKQAILLDCKRAALASTVLLIGLTVASQPTLAQLTIARPTSDNPALQPFQSTCTISIGRTGFCALGMVPAGKRLVIETVSASIALPPGDMPNSLTVTTIAAGIRAEHFLAPVRIGYTPGAGGGVQSDVFAATAAVRIYGDPGSAVAASVEQSATYKGGALFRISISGYLVNLN